MGGGLTCWDTAPERVLQWANYPLTPLPRKPIHGRNLLDAAFKVENGRGVDHGASDGDSTINRRRLLGGVKW
jgi:hypothetical protein